MSPKRNRTNKQIKVPKVRLIDQNGNHMGIISIQEALLMAEQVSLDLVEVSPAADPPVCRIMDYGKFLYNKAKKERKSRQTSRTEIKEIRLRPKTGEHDIAFKIRDARRFLKAGNKVKVRVRFRGREIHYPEIALELLERFSAELEDVSEVEKRASMEGRSMLIILSPATSN
ncbi:MAG: translation initiation factor IF-3 [Anaerolineaceae bacterium 4572_32.1]|nr:MAG: translation initiation factor IF-3 [Anaerolineaceae bacterium 4572_32.1]